MPPVKRYGSSSSRRRNALPLLSMSSGLLSREKRVRTVFGCPRGLEDSLRADATVGGGLELIRAGGTAGLPTLDAAQLLEVVLDLGTATTACLHFRPPRRRADPSRSKRRSRDEAVTEVCGMYETRLSRRPVGDSKWAKGDPPSMPQLFH